MSPLEIERDDRCAVPGGTQALLKAGGDVAGAGPHIQNSNRPIAQSANARLQVPFQDARPSPVPVDQAQVLEVAPHLGARKIRIVESFAAGAARRDEEAQPSTRLSTSALFLEPKPMQLQRAWAKEDGRERFGT